MSNLNNTETHKYFYYYLTRTKLNELMWRVENGRFMADVHKKMFENNIKDQYITIAIKESPTNNDVYIVIDLYVLHEHIGHITFHLIPYNFRKGTIGPLHIKNKKQTTTRIRVTRKQGQHPYIKVSVGSDIPGSSPLNNRVISITNFVFEILNDYFDPKSQNSLSRITYKRDQPLLERIIQETNEEYYRSQGM